MRRSTVLSLPPQLVFPALTFYFKVLPPGNFFSVMINLFQNSKAGFNSQFLYSGAEGPVL